jgi:hypothetical protein
MSNSLDPERRPAPPDWLYDPEARRWSYRSEAGEATLCWLPPDDYGGGQWNICYRRADGRSGGGGLLRPMAREKAMAVAVGCLETEAGDV